MDISPIQKSGVARTNKLIEGGNWPGDPVPKELKGLPSNILIRPRMVLWRIWPIRKLRTAKDIEEKIKELRKLIKISYGSDRMEEEHLKKEIAFLELELEKQKKKDELSSGFQKAVRHDFIDVPERKRRMLEEAEDLRIRLNHFVMLGKKHPTSSESIQNDVIPAIVRKLKEADAEKFRDVADSYERMLGNAVNELKRRGAYTLELDDYLRKQT